MLIPTPQDIQLREKVAPIIGIVNAFIISALFYFLLFVLLCR